MQSSVLACWLDFGQAGLSSLPTSAFVSLKGNPWHLNVLGVKLRDVTIEKVVFRDLGTPAAPVLAAVTLEQSQ